MHINKVKIEADDSIAYSYHSFCLPQHHYTTTTCLPIGRAATRSGPRSVLKWLDLALAATAVPRQLTNDNTTVANPYQINSELMQYMMCESLVPKCVAVVKF